MMTELQYLNALSLLGLIWTRQVSLAGCDRRGGHAALLQIEYRLLAQRLEAP